MSELIQKFGNKTFKLIKFTLAVKKFKFLKFFPNLFLYDCLTYIIAALCISCYGSQFIGVQAHTHTYTHMFLLYNTH